MSSVASEARPVLPSRPYSPSPRNHPEPDAGQPGTPFADLLDSTTAASAPPPAQQAARPDRPQPADRPDRNADSQQASDAASPDSSPAPTGNDAKATTDSKDGATVDGSKQAKDGEATASADTTTEKPKTESDQSAALNAMFVDAPTPVVTVAPIAIPTLVANAAATIKTDTPESDALAALQAAGSASPNAAPKSGQAAGDKPADAPAKAAAPADSQTGVPQVDVSKDGQARGNGGKTAGEFHHAAAELLAKPNAAAPASQGTDAGAAVKASADAMQSLGVASPANATPAATATANIQAPAQTQAVAMPLSGLAVEIASQAHAGKSHFEIRLDPPDLGRIDVKLDVDRDGNGTVRLVVDRADTLDLLKRDASALERALQQSGLKTSDNGLEFSLRQQGFARDDTQAQSTVQLNVPDDDPAPLEAMRQGYGRLLGLGGGLDIRV